MVIFHSYVSLPEGRILEVLASNTLEHMPGTMQPKNLGPFLKFSDVEKMCAIVAGSTFPTVEMSRSATPATRNDVARRLKPPKVTTFAIRPSPRSCCEHLRTVANGCQQRRANTSPPGKNRDRVTEDCKGVKALAVTICLGISPLGFMFGV